MVVMLRFVRPNLFLDSVLELGAARLHGLGLNSLLLDMDCTLKDHHAAEVGSEVREWIAALRADNISLCILSNGRTKRISRLAESLGVPFVAKAYKPLPFRCRQAVKRLQLDRSRTAVVGDQLFADVLAGRLAGLFTILVRPTSPIEPWFTRLKRPLERHVLRWMADRPGTPEVLSSQLLKTQNQSAKIRQSSLIPNPSSLS
jgi:hypothetical protein